MNNYEMIYILDASISDEEKEALVAKFVYMAFSGDSNLVQEVKRVVGITEHVLRRLITRV